MVTEQDQARISAAIKEAESRTSGEIVCTLADDEHRYVEWVLALAAVIAFVLPIVLALLGFGPSRWATWLGVWMGGPLSERHMIELYAGAQAVVLILATAALWWSPFAQRWAPQALRRERVHEAALKQFLARGIHLTSRRTGVLIHVSLRDHMVEVVADTAIYEKMPPDHWAATVEALLAGIKRGDLGQAFVDAIAHAGEVLAEHFPAGEASHDELPNRLLLV